VHHNYDRIAIQNIFRPSGKVAPLVTTLMPEEDIGVGTSPGQKIREWTMERLIVLGERTPLLNLFPELDRQVGTNWQHIDSRQGLDILPFPPELYTCLAPAPADP
jgi:hypothetical protein